MPRWKKTGRMRRAYVNPPKGRIYNSSLIPNLQGRVLAPTHVDPFSELSHFFALNNEQTFNKIRHLMEVRAKMRVENLHHNRHIKDVYLSVVLQESKYFKLVLFWNTGAGKYFFIRHKTDLVSISKPYESRASAMDAHSHRDIFWLDFIRIG